MATKISEYIIMYNVRNLDDLGKVSNINARYGFFRNRMGYAFEGAIHEGVSELNGARYLLYGFDVFHTGYQASTYSKQKKKQRNWDISKKLLKTRDVEAFYDLARILHSRKKYKMAKTIAERYLGLRKTGGRRFEMLSCVVSALFYSGKYRESLSYAFKMLDENPMFYEAYYYICLNLIKQGEINNSLMYLSIFNSFEKKVGFRVVEMSFDKMRKQLIENIALHYCSKGDFKMANKYFNEAGINTNSIDCGNMGDIFRYYNKAIDKRLTDSSLSFVSNYAAPQSIRVDENTIVSI